MSIPINVYQKYPDAIRIRTGDYSRFYVKRDGKMILVYTRSEHVDPPREFWVRNG